MVKSAFRKHVATPKKATDWFILNLHTKKNFLLLMSSNKKYFMAYRKTNFSGRRFLDVETFNRWLLKPTKHETSNIVLRSLISNSFCIALFTCFIFQISVSFIGTVVEDRSTQLIPPFKYCTWRIFNSFVKIKIAEGRKNIAFRFRDFIY